MNTKLMRFIKRLKPAFQEGKIWVFYNVVGIVGYLAIEAWLFAPRIPEEAFNGIDQLCFWTTMQFPVLCLYLGINLTWILMSRKSPFFKSRHLRLGLMVCAAWGIVLLLDPIAVRIVYLFIMIYGGFENHDS